jgi:hypothetical protein
MDVLDGNLPASDNDWEPTMRDGDIAVRRWIGNLLQGRSYTVEQISSKTAGRKWINDEIESSWNNKKGPVEIVNHHLHDAPLQLSRKGASLFSLFSIHRGA